MEVNHLGIEESFRKVTSSTGIRLSDDADKLPFTYPVDYTKSKDSNKLMLYGVNGSGKTRCIYEIVEEKIKTKCFNRVITIGSSSEVKPDGKATVFELASTIVREEDLVIWDNFPDGYIRGQNLQLGFDKLVEISSSNVKNLLISTKSDYLEKYWDKIIELSELNHSLLRNYRQLQASSRSQRSKCVYHACVK